MDEAMIAAGIGCRRGVGAADVIAALRSALEEARLSPFDLDCIAIPCFKENEAGVREASDALNIPLCLVDQGDLERAARRTVTHSERVRVHTGLSSIAEAAALAAAGPDSRLHLPRRATGAVTCAIAMKEPLP